jgi:hypothetical protein
MAQLANGLIADMFSSTVPGVALHPSLPAPDTLFYSLSEI